MNVLANQKIRRLFHVLTLILVFFALFCIVFIKLTPKYASFSVLILSLCTGLGILTAVFHYFSEQDKPIKSAIVHMRQFPGKTKKRELNVTRKASSTSVSRDQFPGCCPKSSC